MENLIFGNTMVLSYRSMCYLVRFCICPWRRIRNLWIHLWDHRHMRSGALHTIYPFKSCHVEAVPYHLIIKDSISTTMSHRRVRFYRCSKLCHRMAVPLVMTCVDHCSEHMLMIRTTPKYLLTGPCCHCRPLNGFLCILYTMHVHGSLQYQTAQTLFNTN